MANTSSTSPEEKINTNIEATWHHVDRGDYNAALFCIGEAHTIAAMSDVRTEVYDNVEAADEKLTNILDAF